MVFRELVAMVARVQAPVVSELLLIIAVAEPPKTHVHGLCVAGQDVVGHNAQGGAIVGLGWGDGLFVAHFVEEGLTWHGFVCVYVERFKLGFCSQRHD